MLFFFHFPMLFPLLSDVSVGFLFLSLRIYRFSRFSFLSSCSVPVVHMGFSHFFLFVCRSRWLSSSFFFFQVIVLRPSSPVHVSWQKNKKVTEFIKTTVSTNFRLTCFLGKSAPPPWSGGPSCSNQRIHGGSIIPQNDPRKTAISCKKSHPTKENKLGLDSPWNSCPSHMPPSFARQSQLPALLPVRLSELGSGGRSGDPSA